MKYKNIDNELYKILKLNAKDCLKYGYGKSVWNKCGVNDTALLNKIWNDAKQELIKEY